MHLWHSSTEEFVSIGYILFPPDWIQILAIYSYFNSLDTDTLCIITMIHVVT